MQNDIYIQQYQRFKAKHPGCTLLFRIGDFYEIFGEDAERVGREIGLTVTSRGTMPMCGLPYHQLETYLRKLIDRGHRVAVCEKIEQKAEDRQPPEVAQRGAKSAEQLGLFGGVGGAS